VVLFFFLFSALFSIKFINKMPLLLIKVDERWLQSVSKHEEVLYAFELGVWFDVLDVFDVIDVQKI